MQSDISSIAVICEASKIQSIIILSLYQSIKRLLLPAVMSSSSSMIMQVKFLSANATMPQRGSKQAAGYDLFSANTVDVTVPAHGKALIMTDLTIAVPEGYYGRVAPRSGLATKHFVDVGAGVIDSDYRGNVGVVLFNFSNVDFVVKPKDRIAQLIIEKIATPELVLVTEFEEAIKSTERGTGGFGSTGGFTVNQGW